MHVIRASLRFLSWQQQKSAAAELRTIYAAPSRDAALVALERLDVRLRDDIREPI